ncbi:MAG: hypothetical protein HFJ45_08070 [Clostridia bacterium]|nr:hypothetical protein [Clostridia bacterium]
MSKKNSLNPIAHKEVDYLDPEDKGKGEKKSGHDIANDIKFAIDGAKKAIQGIKALFHLLASPVGWIILLILLIILVIVELISLAFGLSMMPGLMQSKLRNIFKQMLNEAQGWLMTAASAALDDDGADIVEVANYLEEMGYDLVGYGFVTPSLGSLNSFPTLEELLENDEYTYEKDDDGIWHFYRDGQVWSDNGFVNKAGKEYPSAYGKYYNELGIAVDNVSNELMLDRDTYQDKYGIIRSSIDINNNGDGKLVYKQTFAGDEVNSVKKDNISHYRLIRTYLLSDYRIYTLRNDDDGLLETIYANIKRLFGSYKDAWAKGLIHVFTSEKGIAKEAWGAGEHITGDNITITRDTMTLKNGYFNNPVTFTTTGWSPRYGLSLEFLLSLHLGTMAPDLVYAMLQNFDIEIQVYLEDSGDSKVNAKYLDPLSDSEEEEVTLGSIEAALKDSGADFSSGTIKNLGDATLTQDWVNGLILSKKNCMTILKHTALVSPDNCTGGITDYEIEYDTYTSGSYYEDLEGEDSNRNILNDKYNYQDSHIESIDLEYYESGEDSVKYTPATMLQSVKYSSEYNSYNTATFENEQDPKQEDLDIAYEKATKDREAAHDILFNKAHLSDSDINTIVEDNIITRDSRNPNIKYRIEKSTEMCEDATVYGWFDEANGKWNYGTEDDYNNKRGGHEWEDTSLVYYSYIYKIYKTVEQGNGNQGSTTNNKNKLRAQLVLAYSDKLEQDLKAVSGEVYTINVYENENGEYEFEALKNGTVDSGCIFKLKNTKMGGAQDWKFYPSSLVNSLKITDENINNYDIFGITLFLNNGPRFIYADETYTWLDDVKSIKHVDTPYADNDENKPSSGDTIVLNQEYQIDVLYVTVILKNRSQKELQYYKVLDEDGNRTGEYKCSNAPDEITSCCTNCQNYVKSVVQGLSHISDQDFKMYTPYIARVVGSWFRNTYFIVPKESSNDEAINNYAKGHKEFKKEVAQGDTVEFVRVDEEYLSDTKEYWTSYKKKDDGSDEYQLYYLEPDGTTTTKTLEEFLEEEHTYKENGEEVTRKFANKEEAEKAGFAFVKKAESINVGDLADVSTNMQNEENEIGPDILWSAYSFSTSGNSTNWTRVEHGDNTEVDKLYEKIWKFDEDGSSSEENTSKGIFFNIETTNQVTQEEDAQRGQTNALVKYLFKYRKYYIYDGTRETAVLIEEDKNKLMDDYVNNTLKKYYGSNWKKDVRDLLHTYGRSAVRSAYSSFDIVNDDAEELAEQWLEWQLDMFYMDKYNVDLKQYYNTTEDLLKLDEDPRNKDLINIVNITKSSLNSFSILENVGTVDADYQYRDFKELIVELNYFDKEDLSEKPDSIFTWILPETGPMGWPNRPWDKQDIEYGALIESVETYNALKSERLKMIDDEVQSEDDEDLNGPQNPEEDTNTNPNDSPTTTPGEDANDNPSDDTTIPEEQKSVDESKIMFLGDSWTEGLKNFGIPTSTYIDGRQGLNAKDFIETPPTIPADASAIVIEFGLNGVTEFTGTQQLATQMKTEHPDIPIFVVAAPHVASGYTSSDPDYPTADAFNTALDNYNEQMKTFCELAEGVTFIDPTEVITENGYLKEEYASGTYHLKKEGYQIWYDAIIEQIKLNTDGFVDNAQLVRFEGWKADQLVCSPVTGKVLEYGTHKRMNVYSGKMEEVGYITIEVLSEGADNSGNGTKTGYFTDEMVKTATYETETENYPSAADALNLFYKEYDTNCAGYTIMLDGFTVDLTTKDENDNEGAYEKNDVVALYKSEEEEKRKEMEQAKEDAPFFINNGGGELPSMEEGYKASADFTGFYVKEGKYLGKTTEPSAISTDETETPESIYSQYEEGTPADYIRIIMKDLDYSLVDNIEDYFDIPEPEEAGKNASGIYADLEAITDDSSVEEKIRAVISYFVSQGLTEEAAAGICGNLLVEGYDWRETKIWLYPKIGYPSAGYRGIAQWSANSWWPKQVAWMTENGYDEYSLAGQVRSIYESPERGGMTEERWTKIKAMTDYREATEFFCIYYEGCHETRSTPGDPTEYGYTDGCGCTRYQGLNTRKDYAKVALDVYHGGTFVAVN